MKIEADMSESLESIFIDDTAEKRSFNITFLLATSVIGSWLTLIIAVMSPNVGWVGLIGSYVFGSMIGIVVGIFILVRFGLVELLQSERGIEKDRN
jgi:hypothetical protein